MARVKQYNMSEKLMVARRQKNAPEDAEKKKKKHGEMSSKERNFP